MLKKEEARPTPASVSGTSSNTESISDITTANDSREVISKTNTDEHAAHTSDDVTDAVDDAPKSVAADAEANEPAAASSKPSVLSPYPVEPQLDGRPKYGKDPFPENVVALQRAIAAGLEGHDDACKSISAAIATELEKRCSPEVRFIELRPDPKPIAKALVAALCGAGFAPMYGDEQLDFDLEDGVCVSNLFGPGGPRDNMSLHSLADVKSYVAHAIAGEVRSYVEPPAAHTIAGMFINIVKKLVRRNNANAIDKSDKWTMPQDPMDGYCAAVMCAAEHSRPKHGLLVMEIAADKPTGSDSEDRAGNGILRWFDPDRHKWVLAEMRDGDAVSGPIRDMFYAYCPCGSEREFDVFRVNLRRLASEVDVGAMLLAGEIDPRWSLVNGGTMAWHRATYELKPLVGNPKELGYKGTVIGAYMEDDGTGHAVRVEPPEYDVTTVGGEKKRWNAARDFFQPMFPGQEEAGVDSMQQVVGHWVGRSPDDRCVPDVYGGAKGGKSTLIRSLQRLCGGQFARLSLGDFGKNKALATIPGKYAIIGEDNAPNERMTGDGTATFKNVVDQGIFPCDPLFQDRVLMRFTGGIIMGGNTLTRTDDRTGAVASRIVPIKIAHTFEHDPNRVREVLSRIINDNQFLVWLAQWGNDACEDGMFGEFDTSNPIIAASKQEFMDASDWVRPFMKKHVEELDAAGADCELVPGLYEAFKADYAKNVSGHGNTVTLDRDFRLSLVKVADELGFTITLDKNEQFMSVKPRRGFYEPDLLHAMYRNYTEPMRTDFPSGRAIWKNHQLMKWVSPTDLYGNPASGQTGLLSGTIRGVMYRKSALERFEQEGITPAQARAQRRAEKHRAAWEAASKDDRNRYRNYIERLFTPADAKKVGPDFLDFGVGDDGAARATVYVHRDTGFAYVAPTMDEWIAQRRPHNVVPYNKVKEYSDYTVLEVGFAHDPSEAWYVVTDESNIYVDKCACLDDELSSDERYRKFCAVARRYLKEAGGYKVVIGPPKREIVFREVLPRDEWEAYGEPYSGGCDTAGGKRLGLILRGHDSGPVSSALTTLENNETPAQTPDQPSAPADGEEKAPASTGEPAPANEPPAGSEAATPPDDAQPTSPQESAEPAPGPDPAPSAP